MTQSQGGAGWGSTEARREELELWVAGELGAGSGAALLEFGLLQHGLCSSGLQVGAGSSLSQVQEHLQALAVPEGPWSCLKWGQPARRPVATAA